MTAKSGNRKVVKIPQYNVGEKISRYCSSQFNSSSLAKKILLSTSCLIKDIVQPKKRGVKRGTIRTVMTSHTIADVFLNT